MQTDLLEKKVGQKTYGDEQKKAVQVIAKKINAKQKVIDIKRYPQTGA